MNPPDASEGLFRIDAAGCADGTGFALSPASLLLRVSGPARLEVLAVGSPETVSRHEAAGGACRLERPHSILLPALVNAHTHLDLTHVGPQPFDPKGGFTGWIGMIRERRASGFLPGIQSVRRGVGLCLMGGAAAVGDIVAGGPEAAQAQLRDASLSGAAFLEMLGIGSKEPLAIERVRSWAADIRSGGPNGWGGVAVGLQPHAPYSAGMKLYEVAAELCRAANAPFATHLAESRDEHDLVAEGRGPLRDFLESLGLWTTSLASCFGRGLSPVRYLYPVLQAIPTLAAHVNDCSDDDLNLLARTRTSVVYCPRSASYFGHHADFGPHRYQDMLSAGINVCLGTDSIVNLPPQHADRLSPLDEMRFLWARDRFSPVKLLAMATIHGARALGLDPNRFTLAPLGATYGGEGRRVAGIIGVDASDTDPMLPPLIRVLESCSLPEWLPLPPEAAMEAGG